MAGMARTPDVVRPLALTLAVMTGCSFGWVRGPAPGRARCTRSYAAPIVDSLIATPVLALGVAGAATAQDNDIFPEEAIYGPLLVLGLIDGISAVYGYRTVRRCRAAR